jgi:hypothetical protein
VYNSVSGIRDISINLILLMKKCLILPFVFFSLIAFSQKTLQSPKEFLGYELGDRFTRHHRVVEYFRHVAEVADNIDVSQYGSTYEGRPLIYAIVASPANYKNLDKIRTDNLKRAGVAEGSPMDRTAIVWLSYNVHGNEASSLEASMWTLYELANPANKQTQDWLKNTIVIIDPCINPDGRDRYANFYNQYGNKPFNPNGDAKEHREPWPGGRTNHYLFDLNRDWAWESQVESQQRIRIYNQWLPHVHVDFHEQGYNNPYYFAPAAEPFHEVISPWQREFQTMIGKNNAKYFDQEGWLYFTKEVFDLYYPSYGDTYPTYSGAIGMTYEQAGSGYAGLAITTETGDPLTLKDRLTHHHTTGLSTIEITSQNSSRVIDEFEKYYRENNTNPSAPYKTYVIKSENQPDKINMLVQWLDTHSIRYGHPAGTKISKGYDYQNQATGNVTVTPEDIVISTFQPKSRFITTVFEPTSKLPDSLTYDITAWNLIYGYDLKAFALTERIQVSKPFQAKNFNYDNVGEKPYAYIFPYKTIHDVAFLASLMANNIRVRSAERAFTVGGENYSPGTLIVTRRNNEHIPGFDSVIVGLAKKSGRPIQTSSTGFVEKGKDFGSSDLNFIKSPKVACVFGEQTYSLSSGEIWHYFEQQIHYPLTQIGTDYFRNVDLKKYDVLIVPEGSYRLFDETTLGDVGSWVEKGGRLILIGNAVNAFADKPGFGLKRFASVDEKSEAERKEKARKEKEGFPRYEDTERRMVSETISGAIYKVKVDNSHPLGFGLGDHYYSLKTNELRFAFLENGWNVGAFKGKTKPVQGFAGFRINASLENSVVFGVEEKGQGEVVYLVDNPLFRAFWENGKMLFGNAVFMVGQ